MDEKKNLLFQSDIEREKQNKKLRSSNLVKTGMRIDESKGVE